MPSQVCRYPTCGVILKQKGYCPVHQVKAAAPSADYDRYQRDPEAKKFYASARWQRTRMVQLTHHPLCQERGCRQLAEHVHHKKPVRQIMHTEPHLLFAGENLESLCAACHTRREKSCSS